VNARQAEAYLLDLELFGMRFGLDRMHKLMTVLGMPQRRFASIHVVGSNGKSSTVRMIAAILERHGLRTGTYTSPHLRSFAERIEVGEKPIGDAEFAAAVTRVAKAAELVNRTQDADDRVTQFEALTAAAYHELARARVEVAVIEAGLGGRYDATNVIPSEVQVLTSVGLEHTRWLGPTIKDIAGEKLAVVREGATLVLGDEHPDVLALAEQTGAHIVRPASVGIDAPGYQRLNLGAAVAAAKAVLGGALDTAPISLLVPGRLQVVGHDPLTIYDGAHNAPGIAALAQSVPQGTVAVLSVLDDKDAAEMLRALLPRLSAVVFTRAPNPRALSPATLADLAQKVGATIATEIEPEPRKAVSRAQEIAGEHGTVLATGSIYLVADLLSAPGARRASAL
jgi:dihydrofolate synthase / folylpolyglutamate synthase